MIITGSHVVYAILHLVIIAGLGYFLRRRNIMQESADTFLTTLLVNVSFPCLAFSTIAGQFTTGQLPVLGTLFIADIGIFIAGVVTAGFSFLFLRRLPHKKEITALAAFQNCAYIPMNLALFIQEPLFRERFLLYVFLYTAGFNLIMWSLGSFLVLKKKEERFDVGTLLSPPVSSVFVSLAVVLTGLVRYIPGVLLSSIRTIGDASFFLSLLLLGSALSLIDVRIFRNKHILFALGAATILKLLVVPLLVHALNMQFAVRGLLGFFILVEAAMPAAVSLIVVGAYRKANVQFLSAGIFLTTVVSVVTIPLWLNMYRYYM